MGSSTVGDVVLVPFPYSDLSAAKRRPALVVARADHGDLIVCQLTSRPYSSSRAVEIINNDFTTGGLARTSFARPDKLFTVSERLIISVPGRLVNAKAVSVRAAIILLLTEFPQTLDEG